MGNSVDPLRGVQKPEAVVGAIRRLVRGKGIEKDRGRSEVRGCINFYKQQKGMGHVVEFLQKVLNRA